MEEFFSQSNHNISLGVQIIISSFFVLFVIFLLRKTSKGSIDLFDAIFLSLIGAIPISIVVAPLFWFKLSKLLGIQYPFVLLFGLLFVVTGFYITLLASRINKSRRSIRTLVQEIAILEQRLRLLNNNKVIKND